jgi:hypothetical protein
MVRERERGSPNYGHFSALDVPLFEGIVSVRMEGESAPPLFVSLCSAKPRGRGTFFTEGNKGNEVKRLSESGKGRAGCQHLPVLCRLKPPAKFLLRSPQLQPVPFSTQPVPHHYPVNHVNPV